MKRHLQDIYNASKETTFQRFKSRVATPGKTNMLIPIKSEASVTMKKPRVELTALFTDVAALTREKSQLKVYTNHCYRVNRHSKPVVVEICPSGSGFIEG